MKEQWDLRVNFRVKVLNRTDGVVVCEVTTSLEGVSAYLSISLASINYITFCDGCRNKQALSLLLNGMETKQAERKLTSRGESGPGKQCCSHSFASRCQEVEVKGEEMRNTYINI